ncbi:MAG: RidA family protein [Spirochaetaceae bacterium]|nr:MAG: RidA family protein [Spirochaetaceae bacterium]
MAISRLYTANAPEPVGPYSQATLANGFIFTAGQLGIDPKTKAIVGDSIEKETRQALENLRHVLAAGNAGFADVLSTNIYLTDLSVWKIVNQVYDLIMDGNKPARTTVGVSSLPLGGHVEISMIAAVP